MRRPRFNIFNEEGDRKERKAFLDFATKMMPSEPSCSGVSFLIRLAVMYGKFFYFLLTTALSPLSKSHPLRSVSGPHNHWTCPQQDSVCCDASTAYTRKKEAAILQTFSFWSLPRKVIFCCDHGMIRKDCMPNIGYLSTKTKKQKTSVFSNFSIVFGRFQQTFREYLYCISKRDFFVFEEHLRFLFHPSLMISGIKSV
jgi:hypothetical protein